MDSKFIVVFITIDTPANAQKLADKLLPLKKLPASISSPKFHRNTGGRVKSKKPMKSCSSSKPAPPSSMNSLHSSNKTTPMPSRNHRGPHRRRNPDICLARKETK